MSSAIPAAPTATAGTGEAAFTASNLMVNATIADLRGDADDLHTVAGTSYAKPLCTILDWIREAT